MILKDAVRLLYNEFIISREKQAWADLGCGSGTFTKALAAILPHGSLIYAVDKDKSAIQKIPDHYGNSGIKKIPEDFTETVLPVELDGILMANSLHYVKNKKAFLEKIQSNIKDNGCLLIVEYDLSVSNPWIPYPVSFNSLKKLFDEEKYRIVKLGDHPSIYRKEKIYLALIKKISGANIYS
jgi:2-polyprenyl-3-methyl-5-hydroxy-6-metoxy-1,4-benzoquinol methylase